MKKNAIRWAGMAVVPVLAAAMAVPMIQVFWGQIKVRAAGGVRIKSDYFPDSIFRKYVSDNYDVNPKDSFLSEEELAAVTSIDVRDMKITDLKGIEYFTSLQNLDCRTNEIAQLDLEKNTELKFLNCSENKIEQLDLGKNTKLSTLDCSNNNLSRLNPPNLPSLRILNCYNNNLTELSMSNMSELREFSCHDNQIKSLFLRYCTKLYELNCANNQLLQLDLRENAMLEKVFCQGNKIESVYVPNVTKLKTLNCSDNWIDYIDLKESPDLSYLNLSMNRLLSLDVKKYTNLHYLYCHTNSLRSLDLSACTKLMEMDCSRNYFTSQPTVPDGCVLTYSPQNTFVSGSIPVDKTHFPDAAFRQFISLEIDNAPLDGWLSKKEINAATVLDCSGKGIVSLEGIEYFSNLQYFDCSSNNLITLDLKSNKELFKLTCRNNPEFYGLYISGLEKLEIVYGSKCSIATLDISTTPNLKSLEVNDNKLIKLDVSSNLKLKTLEVNNNRLTSLDVSKNTALTDLECANNSIPLLDVTPCTGLKILHCEYNYLEKVTGIPKGCTYLYTTPQKTVPPVTGLSGYSMSENEIHLEWNRTVGVDGYEVYMYNSQNSSFYTKTVVDANTTTKYTIDTLSCDHDYYFKIRSYLTIGKETRYSELSEVVTIRTPVDLNETNFPDKEFRRYAEYKDKDQDGHLTRKELDAVTELMIGDCDIADLTGIEYFDKLEELYCAENKLTSIDLSKNTELRKFNCSLNPNLTVLVFGSNEKLYYVNCSGCNLWKLDVSQNPALMGLDCSINHLTELNLRKNANLMTLNCSENDLTSLDLCNNEWMTDLDIYGNRIDKVDIHHMPNMMEGVMYEGDPELHVIETYYIDASGVKHDIYMAGAESAHVCYDKTTKLIIKELAKCTVTFDANGGSGSVNAITCLEEDSVTLPANTFTAPSGKVFDKWSCGNPGESIVVTADMTIKAIWKDASTVPTPVTDKTVEVGKSFQYTVSGVSSSLINWSTGNTAVATVDSTGKVTGKSVGNTYLHVGLPNGKTIKCLVRVVYPTLSIRYSEKTLHINQTFAFTVNGAAGQKITWSVGNTAVATVDSTGKVTGKSAANTYLYAKSADGRVAKCLVKVIDPGTLGINYTEKTVYLGQSFTFTAKNVGILKPTWSVGNTAIATVDSNGKVTSVSVGNTYLYVKTEDGRSARCLIKVVDPGPLNIRYTEKTIKVGESFQFAAKNPAGQTVTWRVGNTAVATVDANGVVTGKSVANTWLYASTPDGRETKCLLRIVA